MNGKKLACIVLIMFVAAIAYGTQIMGQRTKAMREQSETAEADYRAAEGASDLAKISVVKLRDDTQELSQFLKAWEPSVLRFQTSQEAEQAILSVVRNSGILTVSQRFEIKPTTNNAFMPKIMQGTLIVQDEYSKAMNWLGELERKLPLARITSCRIKQGETGRQINLEVAFDIPLINLEAAL